MSEEVIIKVGDGGFILRENDGHKFSLNPPRGNLILTDRRIIFAKSPVGFGKRMAVAYAGGYLLAHGVWKKYDKVNPEDMDKSLALKDSFAVPLSDISSVTAEKGIKGLTNSKLSIEYRISGRITKCSFFISGGLLGSDPPNEWVETINNTRAGKTL